MKKFKNILVKNKYELYQNMVKTTIDEHYSVTNHEIFLDNDHKNHKWGYRFNGCPTKWLFYCSNTLDNQARL